MSADTPRPYNATDLERFCVLVAAGETFTEAARLAERFEVKAEGLPRSVYASRGLALSKKPAVQARIAELKAAAEEETRKRYGVDRDWVLRKLIDNVDRSMQAQPVLDAEGNPTGEYRYDGATANRALELIGKEFGMFVNRTVNVNADLRDLAKLSDTELVNRFKAAQIRAGAINAGAIALAHAKPAGSAD